MSQNERGIIRSEVLQSDKVHLVYHPLIDHSLTILRNKRTSTEIFRQHASTVSNILLLEATKNLTVRNRRIETPLAAFTGKKLVDEIVAIPVLRAGLAMLDATRDLLPGVVVGFIGLERDEQTAIARLYYRKFPKLLQTSKILILDPMLATGGSFCDTIKAVRALDGADVTLVSIVSAPEGVKRVTTEFPDVQIYTAAIDSHLNAQKFIVPGLGDFGDRYFGT